MNTDEKALIVNAAREYMQAHGLSQGELADLANINESYMSLMMNGKYFANAGKASQVELADKYFVALADAVGFQTGKVYWQTERTIQYMQVLSALADAKRMQTSPLLTLIGEAGAGKTLAKEKFVLSAPKHTYTVTVGGQTGLPDLLEGLCKQLGLEAGGRNRTAERLLKIQLRLRDLVRDGEKPLVIIDEAENLKMYGLQAIKTLYDGLKHHCTTVLIGTNQLERNVLRMVQQDRTGMPQFYSRMKGGIRYIAPVNKGKTGFAIFLDKYKMSKELKQLLIHSCDDYRMLSDAVEPMLREQDRCGRLGEEMDVALFNRVHYRG